MCKAARQRGSVSHSCEARENTSFLFFSLEKVSDFHFQKSLVSYVTCVLLRFSSPRMFSM